MMNIPVDVEGIIVSGRCEVGYRIKIEAVSGGFLILTWNHHEGFDSWVASEEDIAALFQETGWQVEWQM